LRPRLDYPHFLLFHALLQSFDFLLLFLELILRIFAGLLTLLQLMGLLDVLDLQLLTLRSESIDLLVIVILIEIVEFNC